MGKSIFKHLSNNASAQITIGLSIDYSDLSLNKDQDIRIREMSDRNFSVSGIGNLSRRNEKSFVDFCKFLNKTFKSGDILSFDEFWQNNESDDSKGILSDNIIDYSGFFPTDEDVNQNDYVKN